MQIKFGTYTGNSGTPVPVSGVGFQPDVVVVRGGSTNFVIKTGLMAGAFAKVVPGAAAIADNLITIAADGFTAGSDAQVNTTTTTYYYMALKAASDCKVSSYTGNGTSQTISGLGLTPALVICLSEGAAQTRVKTAGMPATTSFSFTNAGGITTAITGLSSGQFTVGADAGANGSGVVIHYIAIPDIAGYVKTLTYTAAGTPVDSTAITGLGFQPKGTFVKSAGSTVACGRFKDQVGDATFDFAATAVQTDRLQQFLSDGYEIGLSSRVQSASTDYHSFSFFEGNSISGAVAPPSSTLSLLGVG